MRDQLPAAVSFGVRNYLPFSPAVLCGVDAQVVLSDPRGVRISMKAEANPTKVVKFCKMLAAFAFLWVTELFSTLQVWTLCGVLAVKVGKGKIHLNYLGICRNHCRIST